MHLTPVENVRRCVVSSPPWVIFTISLVIMAFGVLFLACRLRNDPDYVLKPNMATARYCTISGTKTVSPDESKIVSATSAATGIALPIIVSMRKDFHNDLVNKTGQSSRIFKWIGSLQDGQLGLRGTGANSTVQLEILLDSGSHISCTDSACDWIMIQACAVAHNVAEDSERAQLAEQESSDGIKCNNAEHYRIATGTFDASLINWLAMGDHVDNEEQTTPSSTGDWCGNGTVVTVQRRDMQGLVLIPLLHDTVAARLHLLYTSYFLFTGVLFLVLYAACRRTSRSKQTSRTAQESGTYSKMVNDRE